MTDAAWLLLAFAVFQTLVLWQYATRAHQAEKWLYAIACENHELRHDLDQEQLKNRRLHGQCYEPMNLHN